MEQDFYNLVQTLSFVLLAIAPAIFIFSVTLLGYAVSRAEQEEKAARENDKENIRNEIAEIERTLKQAKSDGDTTALQAKVDDLKKKQEELEQTILEIKEKYTAINLINTVVKPSGAFIASIISGFVASNIEPTFLHGVSLSIVLYVIQFSLVAYGIYKLYLSLSLVQEISITKDESSSFEETKNAYKQALEEYYDSRKEDVKIWFTDKKFPFTVNMDTNLKISFRVKLTKGSILRNANVWFYIDDGIELVSPSEESAWRQSENYNPSSVRTVKISLGDLSIGSNTPRSLKLKTPSFTGKFLLRYEIHADGFKSDSQDVYIEVC